MAMTGQRSQFETEPCRRCGGSGRHSYCQTWGTTCFECGIKPHEPGLGIRLTARGRAAYSYYEASLPQRAAKDLLSGDRILQHHRIYSVERLGEIGNPGSWAMVDGIPQKEGRLDIHCYGVTLSGHAVDELFSVVPTEEERQALVAAALEYQATLTKRGEPRKRKLAVQYAGINV